MKKLIYVTLNMNQVRIEYDVFERRIVDDLVRLGIARDKIGLPFLPVQEET